jgi:hypothetical protein
MNDEDKKNDQAQDDKDLAAKTGVERQSREGFDGTKTRDAGTQHEDRGTPSGEGSDLRVDSPISPESKDDPRPTGA